MVADAREQFARDHGFESYFALVDASAPLPAGDGANWFVGKPGLLLSVDGNGRWFAWNEATLSEALDEPVQWRDARRKESPQVALANSAHPQESDDCMLALLAPLPKWQECDAVH